MQAEVRGEIFDPETAGGMVALFEEYWRCIKLAEHNRSGRNPRYQGMAGKTIGDKLQAKADRLAHDFPRFPEVLKQMEKNK